jgi:hypothetical protein
MRSANHDFHYIVLTALGLAALPTACGGEKGSGDDRPGATSAASTGGSGGVTSTGAGGQAVAASSGGASASTTTGTGGTGGTMERCSFAVMDSLISDFSSYQDNGNWMSLGISGSSFTYADPETAPVMSMFSRALDTASGSLRMTGSIVLYGGFGLAFGPCTDANMYGGISFRIGGTIGAGVAEVQLQTDPNKEPESDRGMCTTGDCKSVFAAITIPATPEVITLAWSDFGGGIPVATTDGTDLYAIQWQFGCGEAPCEIDVTLDDVMFAPIGASTGAGGSGGTTSGMGGSGGTGDGGTGGTGDGGTGGTGDGGTGGTGSGGDGGTGA